MPVHFVDEASIRVRSGKGGDGCVSFRREKYVARGGPSGGDGGRGGHVFLMANPQIHTLLDVGRQFLYRAEDGQPGRSKDCSGRSGRDLEIQLPVGTLVRAHGTGELLIDLAMPESTFRVARGGRGGRGNRAFATAVHQVPREAEKGEPGEDRELYLELKLMADVGLVGLPNAGKSTLLSRISAAHPKIADYPFTTLAPQLGIAELEGQRRLVVADIPGIIEGASRGVGLGLEFLRHVERTRVLIHLLDSHGRTREQLLEDYNVIRSELAAYSEVLAQRPVVTALSKLELVPEAEREPLIGWFETRTGATVLGFSAATGLGLRALLEAAWALAAR